MWRLTLLIASLLLAPGTARAEWLRAEGPNFIAYGDMTADALRERVRLLEEFDTFLRLLTNTSAPPSPNKLQVYFVEGLGEMRVIASVGSDVAGFYRAAPDGIFAVARESSGFQGSADLVLLHEYTHHFMRQYHPAPYPAWYEEGFAEYVATARITPTRIEYGNYSEIRSSWLTRETPWVPYQQILFGNPGQIEAGEFYAQSWLLVHYIMADQGRRDALVRYVQALARGEEPRAAFEAAFRMSPTRVDSAMISYRHRLTFHRIERTAPQPLAVTVTPFPSGGEDAPLVQAALIGEMRESQRVRILERARQLGQQGDGGRRIQARAEILYGDLAAADRLLDPLLTASPQDVELLFLKGLRHLVVGQRDATVRAAQYRLAGGFFARAIHADPNHWQALYRYAQTLPADRLLTDNGQNILLLATSLAPQVTEIRLAAARLLLLRDKFAEAEALLLPLSNQTERRGQPNPATELLRLARAHQRPADTDIFKAEPTED